MTYTDPRVDAYIARSAGFARPVLKHIRKLVHSVCPDVRETIKWSAPFYEHKGILLATPAFKQHCAIVFWKGRLIFGKGDQRKKLRRLTSLADLPGNKTLTGYVKQAVALNDAGVGTPRRRPQARKKLAVPDYFQSALKKNTKALATFGNFSPSCQREYVEWISEARRVKTREQRLKTAIQWLAEGKPRNWKYR